MGFFRGCFVEVVLSACLSLANSEKSLGLYGFPFYSFGLVTSEDALVYSGFLSQERQIMEKFTSAWTAYFSVL